jgi:hypothetical protein
MANLSDHLVVEKEDDVLDQTRVKAMKYSHAYDGISSQIQDELFTKSNLDLSSKKKKYLESPFKRGVTVDDISEFLDYEPVSDLIDFAKVKASESFTIKKYKESVFRGEMLELKRHGLGVITYKNTRVYEGQW